MRETLEPIFGESGAVVAQYVITLVVILALVALVVWLVRRYAMGGLSHGARGRLPRLAIVDALAVDGRRRLVLVRRDNVEHLILIGGTTDVVVEPSIMRTRVVQRPGQPSAPQQQQRPAVPAASAAPVPPPPLPAAMPASSGAAAAAARPSEGRPPRQPIPFPPRRVAARPPERPAERRMPVRPPEIDETAGEPAAAESTIVPEHEARAVTEEIEAAFERPRSPSARFDSLRAEREAIPIPESVEEPPAAIVEAVFEPPPIAENELFAPVGHHEPSEASDLAEVEAPPVEADEAAAPEADPHAGNVSDLEKEMARLLGEISSRRQS